jgi:hypothetical protein
LAIDYLKAQDAKKKKKKEAEALGYEVGSDPKVSGSYKGGQFVWESATRTSWLLGKTTQLC